MMTLADFFTVYRGRVQSQRIHGFISYSAFLFRASLLTFVRTRPILMAGEAEMTLHVDAGVIVDSGERKCVGILGRKCPSHVVIVSNTKQQGVREFILRSPNIHLLPREIALPTLQDWPLYYPH